MTRRTFSQYQDYTLISRQYDICTSNVILSRLEMQGGNGTQEQVPISERSSDGIFQVVVGGLNRKVLHAEGWLAPGSRTARSITVLGPVR